MNTTTFQPIAPRPAPVNTEGPVAWVRANLLADWKTSLATLLIGAVLLWLVPQILNWAIVKAVWAADYEACRADGVGACWGVITEKYRIIIFGRYPYEEQWRPLIATLLLTSLLVLRGADLTRLMVTLGVAMMLFELANKMTWLTGGVDGLQGMEVKPVLGLFRFDMVGKTAFWYALVVLFLLFWAARKLVHSPFGLGLKGIRLNVARMPALGAPVNMRLAAVYTIGAAYAGVAGALMAQTTQFVALDVLSFNRSAELLLILVLGGSGSLYGALIGTVVFMSAHHVLSDMNPEYWQFWLGALLLAIVLFARDGVMGGLRRVGARLGLGAKA